MSFLFFGTALAQFLQYDCLFVSLTNLWVVVSMDCCRLTVADRGVLNIPIKSSASATRKSSCLYFFLVKRTDSFIMRKASMMAVLIRKNNTYFHHFLLGRPTEYFERNWSKMSTPRKKDCYWPTLWGQGTDTTVPSFRRRDMSELIRTGDAVVDRTATGGPSIQTVAVILPSCLN